MPVDTYPDPVIVCSLALAPSSKKPDDLHTNSDVRFQIYAEKDLYGCVGEAARTLVEESHSNVFLPFILNRILDPTTIGTVALELIYGSGYKTFIQRKDGLDVKSFKQMGICLKIGYGGDDDDVDKLPILMPDDDLYTHLVNMAIDLDMSEPQKTPTIYICTGAPLFLFPTEAKNQSTISLVVPNKRGFWTGATYDPSGERESYPKVLPIKAGTFTRKRKKPEEAETKAIEGNNKKIKKESDDEEETEVKPEKKKATPKPKKATPKKTPPKKVVEEESDTDSDSDEEKEEEKKPVEKPVKKRPPGRPKGAKTKKSTPKKPPASPKKSLASKKPPASPKKDDSDVDDESELEDTRAPSPQKPKPSKKRKSSGSSKSSKSKSSSEQPDGGMSDENYYFF
eukprot:CAMPEP_0119015068 /NCGR_PEP_ID=MMETSP1176-20130426/10539_1 /TAXON_ID=265551 /ORGANISM="Synedropsis recta cf, Strain CCMP1620" /LENGTH=396 /DNA_ID=CAMNT_0006968331 /DNA_START=111 /DNA_END=1302 /DNA_ORIENTATION=-